MTRFLLHLALTLLALTLLATVSSIPTVNPGWQLVSAKWHQKQDVPQIIRWLNFTVSTPFLPIVAPCMVFTLSQPVQSAYLLDNSTNNGIPHQTIFPFNYPYLITATQPVPPAGEDAPHVWSITQQGPPPSSGIFNYSQPLYDDGTFSLIDYSGVVLGAIEYALVFQLIGPGGKANSGRAEVEMA